jgi:DNA (cytosine-5)-methyltransferase 1
MKVATVCSGIGSPEQALKELGAEHEISFACEIDKYARQTYLANFEPKMMLTDMTKEDWIGEQFYSDLFIGGIPCQAFSLAGKRMGELDHRGLLFYDFYRYVKNQQPKVFIIENVKGLLSDNDGRTFQNWCHLLGQSMNTHYNMFNHEDSLMYNLHFTVLNSKDYGVPQNRERVFLVGVRNDLPNSFRFPKGERLKIRLKDILEPVVDEKYYLSEETIKTFDRHKERSEKNGLGFGWKPTDGNTIANCINTHGSQIQPGLNFIETIGFINQDTQASQVYDTVGVSPTVSAGTHGYALGYIQEPLLYKEKRTENAKAERRKTGTNAHRDKYIVFEPSDTSNTVTTVQKDNIILVGTLPGFESNGRVYSEDGISPTKRAKQKGHVMVKEATNKGYAEASEGDSINLSNPNSDTRRGRVGKQMANTLDTACNQAVVVNDDNWILGGLQEHQTPRTDGLSPTLTSAMGMGGGQTPVVKSSHRIRRLTPLECMRLQGFPDEYIKPCSDTQTYKQAGNSITVNVMKAIIKNLLEILQMDVNKKTA